MTRGGSLRWSWERSSQKAMVRNPATFAAGVLLYTRTIATRATAWAIRAQKWAQPPFSLGRAEKDKMFPMKLPIRKLHYAMTGESAAAVLGISTSLLRANECEGVVSPDRDSESRRLPSSAFLSCGMDGRNYAIARNSFILGREPVASPRKLKPLLPLPL